MDERIRARCDCFYRVLSDFVEGELPPAEAALVEEHLRRCPPCLVYFEQFKLVHEACGRVDPEGLPEDFDEVMRGVMAAWKKGRCEDPE